jgi:teichuronic acid biosynthesis glycosyltransferase TuaG
MMATTCDVSVIVPAYRSAQTIGRSLASIAAQTLRPVRVIVVDDGSTDGTAEAANVYAGQMNGIDLVVLQQDNAGAGAARNRALRAATTEFVAFLDADDEWLPDKLERSLSVLRETASDLVSHDYQMINGEMETVINCARHFHDQTDPVRSLYLRGFIATSTVVARRQPIMAVEGFDETLPSGQDFDLWLTLMAEHGVTFHVFSESLTRYYVMSGSITSQVEKRRQCNLEILRRYAGSVRGGKLTALLRTLIVQAQSTQAYLAQGKSLDALKTMVVTPFTLMSVLASSQVPSTPRTPLI